MSGPCKFYRDPQGILWSVDTDKYAVQIDGEGLGYSEYLTEEEIAAMFPLVLISREEYETLRQASAVVTIADTR